MDRGEAGTQKEKGTLTRGSLQDLGGSIPMAMLRVRKAPMSRVREH